jgi:hypothetical protein
MFPSFCWFWLPLMFFIAAAEAQVEGCSSSSNTCGNLTISYPFWLTDLKTGRSCGSPGFEVACLNNTPVLQSAIPFSPGFAIMNISYMGNIMHVVDLGKTKLVQASKSCGIQLWNTSDKLGILFRINPINLDLILYNCTKLSHQNENLVETRMRCGNESQIFVHTEDSYDKASVVQGCDAAVILPVLGANNEANASDYERLISDGFLLTWENPPPLARKFTHPNHLLTSQNKSISKCQAVCGYQDYILVQR